MTNHKVAKYRILFAYADWLAELGMKSQIVKQNKLATKETLWMKLARILIFRTVKNIPLVKFNVKLIGFYEAKRSKIPMQRLVNFIVGF